MFQTRTTLIIAYLALFLGCALLAINLYGFAQDIRPSLDPDYDLRFTNDLPTPFNSVIEQVEQLQQMPDLDAYPQQLVETISQGLAHINWNEESNPDRLNQRIPIWENYILFAMGHLTSIPEFEKYHFINIKRSLERGIGICGDASMITSQLLDERGIPNSIITFPGHVIVEATINDRTMLLDSDYGVLMPLSAQQIASSPQLVDYYYQAAGYNLAESIGIQNIYDNDFKRWDGTSHFVTNKYYFEPIAYFLKWCIPLVFVALALWLLMKRSQEKGQRKPW